MLTHRQIDVKSDRSQLLDFHCEINYDCESPWGRTVPFDEYRAKWLSTSQPDSFLSDFKDSMADSRIIVEFWEDDGNVVGYVWVTFADIPEYSLTIAEVMDIAVAMTHRRQGLATEMLAFAERWAKTKGANVLRSDTGTENESSQALHRKTGFKPYRVLLEKLLDVGSF